VLSQRLRELAFLNAGVRITINDEREEGKHHEFCYEGGSSRSSTTSTATQYPAPKPIYVRRQKKQGIDIEIALQYNDSYDEKVFSLRQQYQHPRGGTPPDRLPCPR